MSIRIGSNIASLTAQRKLAETSDRLSAISERLASGLRINKASDDAAGLSISTSLSADARIFAQGVRNLGDGISLLNIADGALSQLSTISQRQLELAEQAANGSYSMQQRVALNVEMNALSKEYNRILGSTTFNGISLFSDQMRNSGISLQTGYGTNGMLSAFVGEEGARDIGDGSYTQIGQTINTTQGYVTMIEMADFNGDGIQDIITSSDGGGSIRINIGSSDGTFAVGVVVGDTAGGNGYLGVGDFNGDGKKDFFVATTGGKVSLYTGNGNGTFALGMTFTDGTFGNAGFAVADINGDGRDDIVQAGNGQGRIYMGNTNGTFSVGSKFGISVSSGSSTVKLVKDSLSNTYYAIFHANSQGNEVVALGTNGQVQGVTQTFGAAIAGGGELATGDFNGDGLADFVQLNNAGNAYQVFHGNGNGTFRAGQTFAGTAGGPYPGVSLKAVDMNEDGVLDLVQTSSSGLITYLGSGEGTFQAGITSTAPVNSTALVIGDINADGVMDVIGNNSAGSTNLYINLGDTTQTMQTKLFDITTQESARQALTFLNKQLEKVSLERGSIGAFMSRINTAIETTLAAKDNYLAAASRITDVDVASEAAELIKHNTLRDVGAAILAQANQVPSLALALLKKD